MRHKKRQYEQNKHFKDYASIYGPIWVFLGVNQIILGILYRKELPVLTYGCCAFLLCCSQPVDELTRPDRKKRIRFSSICGDCTVFLVDSAWRCAVFQWWWIVFAVEVILIVITFFGQKIFVKFRNQMAAITVIRLNGYRNAVGPERGMGVEVHYHYHPTRNHKYLVFDGGRLY